MVLVGEPEGQSGEREWVEMRRRALLSFSRLHVPARPGLRPVFRLWNYPRTGPWRTWVLLTPRPLLIVHEPVVRECSWDREADRVRLARDPRRRPDLNPTLSTKEAELSPETVCALIDRASRISLPPGGPLHPFLAQEVNEHGIEGFSSRPTPWIVWNSPEPHFRAIDQWAQRTRAAFLDALGEDDRSLSAI